jgi:aspartate racemase
MKTLGLIGGTSWESTMDYYKLINEGINKQLGGLNFARCLIYSFNYADIKRNNDNNDWDLTLQWITKACNSLENGGAEGIVLCANTMHFIADRLAQKINLPIIHIATATAAEVKKKNIKKVGLLGTKFTMEFDFFKSKLKDQDIETIIPGDEDRDFIHYTIFEELGCGILKDDTKQRYLSVINKLIAEKADGVILGCTEIPLLIKQEDVTVPVFDTAIIHSAAAVEFALS